MAVRGTISIIYNGKCICLYNHWTSFPEDLGVDLIKELIELLGKFSMEELIAKFENLVIVTNNETPTEEQINKLSQYADVTVSTKTLSDWYCLLHKCQGSIIKTLESGYALHNDTKEIFNYVIDLDQSTLTCDEYTYENIWVKIWNYKLDIDDLKNRLTNY